MLIISIYMALELMVCYNIFHIKKISVKIINNSEYSIDRKVKSARI
jgi:hypothetical protein